MIREKWVIDSNYREKCIVRMVEYLPSLRNAMDISQDEFAQLLGVTRQTYNAVETQKSKMSWTLYLSIVTIFLANENTKELIREYGLYPHEFFQTICYSTLTKNKK